MFRANCWDCKDFYVGKTKRRLRNRKTEHFKALTNLVHRASFPLTSGRKTRALGESISGMRHRYYRCHSRPQSHDPSDMRQGSRALAGPDFLGMCRVSVSYSQPIRFARFDGKSVNRGLPVLGKARALDPCRRSEGSWLWGRECIDADCALRSKTGYAELGFPLLFENGCFQSSRFPNAGQG